MFFKNAVALVLLVLSSQPALAQNSTIIDKVNPRIGINGLFLGRVSTEGSNRTQEAADGFHIQEVETRMMANVDSYFLAAFTFAFEKEPGEDFSFALEEAFVESLSLPWVTVRAGKFFAYLGKHNQYHTHAFPFIDQPIMYDILLGEEGFNEIGVAAAVLLPTPWYSEFVAQAFSATNENLFDTDDADDVTVLMHSNSLWELSRTATFELTGSYGFGNNTFGDQSHIFNGSSTIKWRPANSPNDSLSWTTEFLQTLRENAPSDPRVGGIASWLMWQFNRRWWLQSRFDYLGLPDPTAGETKRYSGLLAFVPTEYSALRLQYDALDEAGAADIVHIVTLQLNVTIGAHPAHPY